MQQYANDYYQSVPQQVQVQPKAPQRLSVQMDELWSFVDDKGNGQWVWLALDVATREIVGCYIGNRSGESAQALWQSLPPSIGNARSVTPICGYPTGLLYSASDIEWWVRKLD